jgi:hypothetical protein
VIVVEQVEASRDRGLLPELPYDEYACRDINAARCVAFVRASVLSDGRRIHMVPWRHPNGQWTYAV